MGSLSPLDGGLGPTGELRGEHFLIWASSSNLRAYRSYKRARLMRALLWGLRAKWGRDELNGADACYSNCGPT